MHAGQLETLSDVLEHYNRALPADAGNSELIALGLMPTSCIKAFFGFRGEDK
jgi:cytochrome c peroxidase